MNSGADLWVIPNIEKSKSAQKLDWYMNFQISRAKEHKTSELSSEMKKILAKCGTSEIQIKKNNSNTIMFDSSHLLPNRWLVVVPENKQSTNWIDQIAQIWVDLRKPTLRVFLPTGLSSGEFQKIWRENQTFDDFTVVVD